MVRRREVMRAHVLSAMLKLGASIAAVAAVSNLNLLAKGGKSS